MCGFKPARMTDLFITQVSQVSTLMLLTCLFLDKPESPRNCHLQNSIYHTLEITCMAGHDGGLEQRFILEVIDIPLTHPSITTLSDEPEHREPVIVKQNNKPQFSLTDLQFGKEYQALVYAENAKGRSEPPIVLSHIKLEEPVLLPEENGKALRL